MDKKYAEVFGEGLKRSYTQADDWGLIYEKVHTAGDAEVLEGS